MALVSELKSLTEIFDVDLDTGVSRIGFIVPDYQRGYSWEKPQVEDLLSDIDHMIRFFDPDRPTRHFMGTLVAAASRDQPNSQEVTYYDLVDGQQRLTTIVLLIDEILRFQHLEKNPPINLKTAFIEREFGATIHFAVPTARPDLTILKKPVQGKWWS